MTPWGQENLAAVPSIGRATGVQQVAAPEADFTRALYEQYANQIFRYCLHQLGSREEAEDAVQSTFLNAFRGIKRGVVPELESAWLFKIAHNVCLSRRRSSWRRGRIESPADFEVVEELTPAPSRHADELIGLQDVLEQMPENQRRAILLREWQGLSYHEIGEELELSQAAVETLIFRARRSLAQGLEQPAERKRRRLVRGADLANVFAGLKSVLLGGSAAVKIAATVAVVSATTVVAAAPVQQHARQHKPAPAKPAAHKPAVASSHGTAGTAVAPSLPAALRIAPGAGHTPVVTGSPSRPAATPSFDTTPAADAPAAQAPPVEAPPAQSPSGAAASSTSAGATQAPAAPGQAGKPDASGQAKKADSPSSDAPGQGKNNDSTGQSGLPVPNPALNSKFAGSTGAVPAAVQAESDNQTANGNGNGNANGNGNGGNGGGGNNDPANNAGNGNGNGNAKGK
jgi:RNA polymerase sigma factor (sigma-70 family)